MALRAITLGVRLTPNSRPSSDHKISKDTKKGSI
jgi:hypothetical protein